ncbi:MAG: AIR synthase-related protein, partial [Acidipropionibacterium jensenii]|nr:AIR synthase-related protein [Acidipropionibacterium jensenii]
HGIGVSLTLPEGEPAVTLFSESPARALVSLSGADYQRFTDLCAEHGVPVARLGEVVDSGEIEIQDLLSLDLATLGKTWQAPIPAAMEI